MLAVTVYYTREDLDILFEQSTQVLDYLDGDDLDQAVALSLVTEPQRKAIFDAGLNPNILDPDVNLSRYVYLFSNKPNDSEQLAYLGDVFPVTQYHTLVRLSPGTSFVQEGPVAAFQIIPLSKTVVTPPLRTKLAPSPIASPSVTTPVQKPSLSPSYLTVGAIVFVVITVILVFFVWYGKKKS